MGQRSVGNGQASAACPWRALEGSTQQQKLPELQSLLINWSPRCTPDEQQRELVSLNLSLSHPKMGLT